MKKLVSAACAAAPIGLAGATLAVLPPTPSQAATTEQKDVIFSLDGSGSIDSSDWQLQKDGYSAAIQDAVAFPRDGSVSVGVNQWSDPSSARVEIPSRIIRTQADVDALVASIQAITQIGSSTDPVSGLELATDQLVAAGRASASWRVCMSSDGVQNDGSGTLPAAAADARGAGVDRFSVVGIEDGGNGAELRGYYGPVVFGGGTFTLARNTAEFSNLIIGGCLNKAVDLVGLEVTQGTQNWSNDVSLVAGKSTVVRAFVEVAAGEDPQRVSGRLIGRRNGTELPGSPLLATNAGAAVLADTNVTARRGTLNASLNFELPASWRSGDVELEFDGAGTGVDCQEAAGPTPDDCVAGVRFTPGGKLKVQVLGVPYQDGGTRRAPSAADLTEQVRRLQSILPASQVIPTYREFVSAESAKPEVWDVNARLEKRRYLDLCFSAFGCTDLYYGLLKGNAPVHSNGGYTVGMAEDIPADIASSFIQSADSPGSTGRWRNTIAHEVGHTIGLNHDVTSDTNASGYKVGDCGEQAAATAPTYPYLERRLGRRVPLLGKAGASSDKAVWGLDTRFARGDVNGLAVVNPGSVTDVMGYCDAPGQGGWPSDYSWRLMRSGLQSRTGTLAARAPSTTGAHLLVSGSIGDDDSIDLDPAAQVDGTFPQPDSGAFSVQLLGSSGNVLSSEPFDVDFDGGPDEEVLHGSFIAAVPVPSAPVAAIRVRRGSVVLTTVSASGAAPTVAVTQPTAGQVVGGADLTVTWTADDADRDPLAYTVRYSPDGGTSWQSLAVDLDQKSVTIPRRDLTQSSNAVVEVQASDGVNVTSARSGTFSVTGSGPTVQITSPHDGDTFYSGVQQVVLEASATDNEDGDVGDSIIWTSDRDGQIATGASGAVRADQLSEGSHVLTATATDSSGRTGQAQVTITVFRVAPTDEVPTITISRPRSGTQVDLTGTLSLAARASDPEDGDLGSAVRWTDESGTTLLTGASGTLAATALGVGSHVLTAGVADSAGQATTDAVTVRVTSSPVTPPPSTPPTPPVSVPPAVGAPDATENVPTGAIRVSGSPRRTASRPLEGQRLSGRAYVFVRLHQVASVRFRLDGRRFGKDTSMPFDLVGSEGARALALETARLLPGRHRLRIKVRYDDGRLAFGTARFKVARQRDRGGVATLRWGRDGLL